MVDMRYSGYFDDRTAGGSSLTDIQIDDVEDALRRADEYAELTGRKKADIIADLLDDGQLNLSAGEDINKKDFLDTAQEQAEKLKSLIITLIPVLTLILGVGAEGFGAIDLTSWGEDSMWEDDEPYYEEPYYPVYWGCTDSSADNYDYQATDDDGSCEYYVYGCTNDAASNYDPAATHDDGSCEPEEVEPVYGCTDDEAENYDPEAEEDDGSCEYPPEPDCVVEIHNHYRGHIQSDAEQDAIQVAFKLVPTDCDGLSVVIEVALYTQGNDNEPEYNHWTTLSGNGEHDYSHTFDGVEVGTWVPRITAFVDDEQKERVWFWTIDVEEQEPESCEINLFGITLTTNNTTASISFDLDCGYEQNDLPGYNVSVQFLAYQNGSTGADDPLEYTTELYFIQGWVEDIHTLSLSNFTIENDTVYDFYFYAIYEVDGETEWIERMWLERDLNP